MLLNKKKIM